MARRRSPDRAVARIAARQHGVFTRAQALGAGFGRRAIEVRLASGRWELVHRGVYRIAGTPQTWFQQVMAGSLATGGAACRRTASTLYGLAGVRSAPIEFVVARSRYPRPPGVVVYRAGSLPGSDLTRIEGIAVTTPGRTIVDLAAVLPIEALEVALDDAIRRRLVKVSELRRRCAGAARGSRALRALLAQRPDPRTVPGSALENAFLRLLRGAGLPPPRRQWPLKRNGRTVAVVDFAYPKQRLAIEIDGYRFHSGRRDWQRDLARQNEIVACGFDVLRFTSSDIEQRPDETCARVAIAVAKRNI